MEPRNVRHRGYRGTKKCLTWGYRGAKKCPTQGVQWSQNDEKKSQCCSFLVKLGKYEHQFASFKIPNKLANVFM